MALDTSDSEMTIDNGTHSVRSNDDIPSHGPTSVGVRRSIINGLQVHAYGNLARNSSNTEVILENETHFNGSLHIAIHGPTPIFDGSCDVVNGIQVHKYDDMMEGGQRNKIHLKSPTVFSGVNIEISSPQENVSASRPPFSQLNNQEKNVSEVEEHRAADPSGPRCRKRSEDGDATVIPPAKKSRRPSFFANLSKIVGRIWNAFY